MQNNVLTIVCKQPTTLQQVEEICSNQLASLITALHISAHPLCNGGNSVVSAYHIVCPADTQLTSELRTALYELKWDFALQKEYRQPKKLFISDMDATMVIGETIDEMAEVLGIKEQVSAITERAMRGELDFEKALSERLCLMQGISRKTVQDITKNICITAGADTLLNYINQKEIDSCLISGGFTEFTDSVSKKLGFKRHKSNQLSYDDNDCLDGNWVGALVNAEVKRETLIELARENNITMEQTIAIGDGANDALMITSAGLGVAFYGKPAARTVANAEIHSGSIDNLIYFI